MLTAIMKKTDKILILGSRGLVGTAAVRDLSKVGIHSLEWEHESNLQAGLKKAVELYLRKK